MVRVKGGEDSNVPPSKGSVHSGCSSPGKALDTPAGQRERDASWLSTQGRGLSRVDEALKSFWLLIGQCPFYASLSVTAQSMLHDHLGINEEVNGLCGPTGQRRQRWTILGPGTHAFSYALPKRDTTPQC